VSVARVLEFFRGSLFRGSGYGNAGRQKHKY
jgi:hypothetical protein